MTPEQITNLILPVVGIVSGCVAFAWVTPHLLKWYTEWRHRRSYDKAVKHINKTLSEAREEAVRLHEEREAEEAAAEEARKKKEKQELAARIWAEDEYEPFGELPEIGDIVRRTTKERGLHLDTAVVTDITVGNVAQYGRKITFDNDPEAYNHDCHFTEVLPSESPKSRVLKRSPEQAERVRILREDRVDGEYEPLGTLPKVGDKIRRWRNGGGPVDFSVVGIVKTSDFDKWGAKIILNHTGSYSHMNTFQQPNTTKSVCRVMARKRTAKSKNDTLADFMAKQVLNNRLSKDQIPLEPKDTKPEIGDIVVMLNNNFQEGTNWSEERLVTISSDSRSAAFTENGRGPLYMDKTDDYRLMKREISKIIVGDRRS